MLNRQAFLEHLLSIRHQGTKVDTAQNSYLRAYRLQEEMKTRGSLIQSSVCTTEIDGSWVGDSGTERRN